jgi:type I site-specific restriction-modification system R (restriction) subunit
MSTCFMPPIWTDPTCPQEYPSRINNKGWNDGAGNPPNPAGMKTDYLWRDMLTKPRLTEILENYAQIV